MRSVSVFILLSVAALVAFWTAPAQACDLCGCPVVIDSTSTFFQPGFSLGLSEQFTRFGTMQFDGSAAPNPLGQYMNSSVTQLFVNYNFDNRIGLQLNVPWISRSWRRAVNNQAESGNAAGIGDMSLVAHYLAVQKFGKDHTFTLNLQGGLKLPTGSSGFLAEELTESTPDEVVEGAPPPIPSGIHGHDLTFGSGSVDGMIGANLFLRQKHLFFAANVQYAIRTRGAYGYQFANDFIWSAGPGIYLDKPGNLKLRLNFSGESKARDNLNGVTADDTGINNVFIGPQLIGNFGSQFYAQAGFDLPIVRDNTALQIVPDYRFNVMANYRF